VTEATNISKPTLLIEKCPLLFVFRSFSVFIYSLKDDVRRTFAFSVSLFHAALWPDLYHTFPLRDVGTHFSTLPFTHKLSF
jgi:hypothetical protein